VVEVQSGAAVGRAEDPLVLGAVDAQPRCAHPVEVGVAVAHRVGGDPLPRRPPAVDQLGRDGGDRLELLQQAHPAQQPRRVAAHADGRTELRQRGRLLEDLGRDAAFPEGQPEGQAADPRSDDGHPQVFRRRRHGANVGDAVPVDRPTFA
jgi:hypothetical protein